jgi:UDP-3-O-[3-hydroxymyristoyl] glucosamine N-acyltransferase
MNLASIVKVLGGELLGDPSICVHDLAPLEAAGPGDLSFLSNPKYQQQLSTSRAACVIVASAMRDLAIARGACIVVDQPYLYFAKVTQLWKQQRVIAKTLTATRADGPWIHPSAVVDASAQIAVSATVGPLCVVESGARIGAYTVLKSRVTVGEDCVVGDRCILHAGVVIGADGFGFAPDGERWEKIEQLGAVQIGNDVEVGANTCIDRGALQDTVIEDGVKLDNLIQIGHNVRVGRNTAMAGCVGVAGSATIGPNCTIGGGAIVLGHLTIGAHVNISAATVVSKSILKPGHYTGMFPIDENASWERNAATLKQLHSLRDRIKHLEKELKK